MSQKNHGCLPSVMPCPRLSAPFRANPRLAVQAQAQPTVYFSRMPPQTFIYVMKDLRRVVPPSREILRGIWLSFYYGAKIGVLGANGAGKSSLLKIMAGVDNDYQGAVWAADGTRDSFLPKEPQLHPSI